VSIKKLLSGLVLLFCIILLGACSPRTERPTTKETAKQKLIGKISSDYDNPDLHYQLGKLHQSDGLWFQAEHEFRVALYNDPAHRPSQAALVRILLDSGQSAKAKESAKFFMDFASPSETATLELGIAFQDENLDDYALACYQKALNMSPASARVNKQLGFFYLKKGDKENAKKYLITSFNANPYQPDVAGELGRLGVAIQAAPQSQTKPAVQPQTQK